MDNEANKAIPDRAGEQQRSESPPAGNSAGSTAGPSANNAGSGAEAIADPEIIDEPGMGEAPVIGGQVLAVSQGGQGDRSAWERVQLARHPQRPHTLDYIERIFQGFQEIHGDRYFADDPAIIGQQKGRDTKQKLYRNFGMPKPEGYRKALRAMRLAEKFGRPVLTFLDTPGAYPGIDAEERGQAEAIARNLFCMAQIRTPIVVTCIGEGGSGGALALGVGNRVLMLENAIYSVISPESCAAIVWRDSSQAALAAKALKLTAEDLLRLGLIDQVVTEPPNGAHNDYDGAAQLLAAALRETLREINKLSEGELVQDRYAKFRSMGNFFEPAP